MQELEIPDIRTQVGAGLVSIMSVHLQDQMNKCKLEMKAGSHEH